MLKENMNEQLIPEDTNNPLGDQKDTSYERRHFAEFMDGEGNLYNIDYLPIPSDHFSLHQQFDPNHSVFAQFPEFSDCKNYEDFNEEVSLWIYKFKEALGDINLPKSVGGVYYRPQWFDPPLGEDIYRSHSEELEQSHHGNEIKSHLHSDPWNTSLYPLEPDPDDYESFEEYELAMQRWATVCKSTLKNIPPHPRDLGNRLNIKPAQERSNLRNSKPTNFVRAKVFFPEEAFDRGIIYTSALSTLPDALNDLHSRTMSNVEFYSSPVAPAIAELPIIKTNRSRFSLFCFGTKNHFEGDNTTGLKTRTGTPILSAERILERETELYVPPTDVIGLDFAKLDEAHYQKFLKSALDKISNENRYDTLYSWYHRLH